VILKFVRARLATALLASLFMCTTAVNAAVIVEVLPEFSFQGSSPFPTAAQDMGTFAFAIPAGETIVSAMLQGTFGNSVNRTSAQHRVFADGALVATCTGAFCENSLVLDPWSFDFSNFSDLLDGSLAMTTVQDAGGIIREGALSLTITTRPTQATTRPTQAVPAPGTLALVGLGLLGANLARRRKATA